MSKAALIWTGANTLISLLTLGVVVYHHRYSVVGPRSAAGRIMLAMCDIKARLSVLDRLLPEMNNRHDS